MCAQVAVCTPGRMIDLIKMKACSCRRVTYLVFDEADRMFDMGFEPQARRGMGFFDLIYQKKYRNAVAQEFSRLCFCFCFIRMHMKWALTITYAAAY